MQGKMLEVLHAAENNLPDLLNDKASWKSLYLNYQLPVVERVWRSWFNYRISLHRMLWNEKEEVLNCTYPWPFAVRLVEGVYRVGLGYGKDPETPPTAATFVLSAGSEYEVTNRYTWHSIKPLSVVSFVLMVSGKPWKIARSGNERIIGELVPKKKDDLLALFLKKYKRG